LADSFDLPVGHADSGRAALRAGKYVVSNIDSDIQQQLDSITQQNPEPHPPSPDHCSLGLYAKDRKHKNPDALVEKMRQDIEIELSHGDDKKLSAFNIYYASRDPKWRRRPRPN